ncbi:MAG: serine protease [Patescibacteria group bacterium]|nr:serine protease [Patescibacteria group bacterium]
MEELNKNQIVLLTLLVSFVTSIATGIVTVTLMDQAPAPVTQTINRVVERTIEKAVPGETKIETVVKEVPVVVTEDKLIVDVINNTSPGAVRITDLEGETVATGFIADASGLVATAKSLLIPLAPIETIDDDAAGLTNEEEVEIDAVEEETPESEPAPTDYLVHFNNGQSLSAKLLETNAEVEVALLKVDLGEVADIGQLAGVGGTTSRQPIVLSLTDDEPLPGQTVVALGLPDAGPINVSGGLVSSVYADGAGVTLIVTTAANVSNLGGPLFNTDGEVIGLNRSVGSAIGAEAIRQAITEIST